jgi:hypothetical protein
MHPSPYPVNGWRKNRKVDLNRQYSKKMYGLNTLMIFEVIMNLGSSIYKHLKIHRKSHPTNIDLKGFCLNPIHCCKQALGRGGSFFAPTDGNSI